MKWIEIIKKRKIELFIGSIHKYWVWNSFFLHSNAIAGKCKYIYIYIVSKPPLSETRCHQVSLIFCIFIHIKKLPFEFVILTTTREKGAKINLAEYFLLNMQYSFITFLYLLIVQFTKWLSDLLHSFFIVPGLMHFTVKIRGFLLYFDFRFHMYISSVLFI